MKIKSLSGALYEVDEIVDGGIAGGIDERAGGAGATGDAAGAERATTGPGGPGGAGGPRGDGSMMLERAQKLVDELKLSDDQKKKVGDIFDKAKDQLKSMRQELENAA